VPRGLSTKVIGGGEKKSVERGSQKKAFRGGAAHSRRIRRKNSNSIRKNLRKKDSSDEFSGPRHLKGIFAERGGRKRGSLGRKPHVSLYRRNPL